MEGEGVFRGGLNCIGHRRSITLFGLNGSETTVIAIRGGGDGSETKLIDDKYCITLRINFIFDKFYP